MLTKIFDTLEGIQKSLEEYLETKRVAFPRYWPANGQWFLMRWFLLQWLLSLHAALPVESNGTILLVNEGRPSVSSTTLTWTSVAQQAPLQAAFSPRCDACCCQVLLPVQ